MEINHEKVLQHFQDFKRRTENGRMELLRNSQENVLFYNGHQWITFDGSRNRFRQLNLRKDIPRPVTNIYKAVLDTINATLSRVEPALTFAPGSDKDDDRLTANMAKSAIKYLEKVTHFDDLRLSLSKGVVVMNNMYVITGWDPNGGASTKIPRWVCPKHPEAPMNAMEAKEAGGKCPIDNEPLQKHKAEVDTITDGEPYLQLATPFEMWVDPTIKQMRDQPEAFYRTMRPIPWVKQRYPDAKADIPSGEASPHDVGLTYLMNIIRLTPGTSFTSFGNGARWENSVTVDDYYVMPCEEFKEGVFARIVGEQEVVEATELPTHEGTEAEPGKKFIPITHFRYDDVPGTHYSTGPADHLKALQRQRNRLQSHIELYFARTANGVWAIPENCDMPDPSGEEGWVFKYRPQAQGGGEPKRMEGGRLPNSFTEWVRYIDQEMHDIAGTYDILRGERPPNVDSGYALQILQERAQGRLAGLYLGWERSYAQLARHLFYVFRLNAPDEVWFKIKGEEARWTLQKIKTADLRGGVDIDVEAGSAAPKTLLQKRAALEQMIQMGLINIQDPKVQLVVARAMGVPEVLQDVNEDDEYIAREHDTLKMWAQQVAPEGELQGDPRNAAMIPIFVKETIDNHPMHIARHRMWMLSEEFNSLPDFVKQLMEMHYNHHMFVMQQQMAMQSGAGEESAQPQRGKSDGGDGSARGEANAAANEKGRGTTGREERKRRNAG